MQFNRKDVLNCLFLSSDSLKDPRKDDKPGSVACGHLSDPAVAGRL